MKLSLSPAIAVSSVTVAVVATALLFGVMPLGRAVAEKRQTIDTTRALIESLAQQQRNIVSVSKNYTRLSEQDVQVETAYLQERNSVDFFNDLDALGDNAGIVNFQKRLDQAGQQPQQLIGLHLTFSASFESALNFIRGLGQLNIIVSPQSLAVTTGTGVNRLNVTIDALVPWELTQ